MSLTASLVGLANAQTAKKNPAERRAELATVQEQINDPDPLMRVAYMEEIVTSGDPLKIEIAIKTAMGSDDPGVRSLAMKAYVAALGTVTFDWLPPPSVAADIDRARGDAERIAEIKEKNPLRREYTNASDKVVLLFQNFDMGNAAFKVFSLTDVSRPHKDYQGDGKIVGDRLLMRLPVYNSNYSCNVELTASPSLGLVGLMNCNGFGEQMTIKSRMY